MLRREGIGRKALRKAKKSNSFLFFSPDFLAKDDSGTRPTKSAIHEIGHAFSKTAGLQDYQNSLSDEVQNTIDLIGESSTRNLNELFESVSGIDDIGTSYEIPSRLDDLKAKHLKYLEALGIEEARAEGFSHKILGRTSRVGENETLLAKYFSFKESKAKREMLDLAKQAAERRKTTIFR